MRYILAGLYAGINGKNINKMFDEGPLSTLSTDQRNALKIVLFVQQITGDQKNGNKLKGIFQSFETCKKFIDSLLNIDPVFKKDISIDILKIEDFEKVKAVLLPLIMKFEI